MWLAHGSPQSRAEAEGLRVNCALVGVGDAGREETLFKAVSPEDTLEPNPTGMTDSQ